MKPVKIAAASLSTAVSILEATLNVGDAVAEGIHTIADEMVYGVRQFQVEQYLEFKELADKGDIVATNMLPDIEARLRSNGLLK